MSNYRDPLLKKICDRIVDLDVPAFVKNSELVFVCVNDAFCSLFSVPQIELIGFSGDSAGLARGLDLHDKERACLVFGDDQRSQYLDPAGKGHFDVDLERFTLADGQTYLYGAFQPRAVDPSRKSDVLTALPLATSPEAGGLASVLDISQIDTFLELLDAGICLWSPDGVLRYANDRLLRYYEGAADNIHIGITFREFADRLYDKFCEVNPEAYPPTAEAREAWIQMRAQWHNRAVATDQVVLANGRCLQFTNRQLPDGSLIGLRCDVTDMKAREVLLDQHVQEIGVYRELLNVLPVAAFARNAAHKLEFVNRAYCDLFGREPFELLGSDEAAIYGPEQVASIRQNNDRTLLDGEVIAHELDLRLTDSRVINAMVRTSRLMTEKGPDYLVGTIDDMSTIRQREQLLREATRRAEDVLKDFEDIVSNVDVGILVLDEALTIQMVNEAYKRHLWTGCTDEWMKSYIGRPFAELLRESYDRDDRLRLAGPFEVYRELRFAEIFGGAIKPREALLHDGLAFLYSSIPLSRGRYMLCYFDLTDIRRRDREIEEARDEIDEAYRLIKTATETMSNGVAVIEDGRNVFSNPAMAHLLNIPPEEMHPGRDWDEILATIGQYNPNLRPETMDMRRQQFRDVMAMHANVNERMRLAEDRWIQVELRWRDNGQCVVLVSDQTPVVAKEQELQHLVAKAEAADQAKSEFLANIGLEFRTPLNGILGMAELLGKSSLDTRQRAFIEIIQKSGNALLSIINDIIEFSNVESGHIQLKYAAFNPAESVEDICSLFGPKAAEKDVELIVERRGSLPAKIMGDAGRFRQIVGHLVANAIQFTEQGHVHVSIEAMPNGLGKVILQVRVEDTGVGIPDEKLATIFDKFSQIDLSAGRTEGAGLGLAIAQRIAHMQGGTITVHSVEDEGSAFSFALPAQVAVDSPREEPIPTTVLGARVVVIDDHEQARKLICENISDWGFECADAPDAETGFSLVSAAMTSGITIDAIIIDESMPDDSGSALVHRLRDTPALAGIAVIMLASGDLADSLAVSNVVAEAYVAKPVRMPLLRSTLIDVVRVKRIRREVSESPYAEDFAPPAIAASDGAYALIAEDNEVNQIFFMQILDMAGIPHRIAADGQQVLEFWRRDRPAIILMDVTLPVLDGLDCARQIRAEEALDGGHVPIIGVISRDREADGQDCLAAGMDDYIAKPITPERVEEKVRLWAGGHFSLISEDNYQL